MPPNTALIQSLKKKYGHKPCFILSAGPSLNEVNTPEWRAIMHKCLVISIKQAATLFPNETDILLTNDYNLIDFSEIKSNTDTIHIHMGQIPIDSDATYLPDPKRKGLEASVAYKGDLERNNLLTDSVAPGPGIMYELAFPLLVNLQASKCIIAGWDMTPATGGYNDHFYKKNQMETWSIRDTLYSYTGKNSLTFKVVSRIIGKRRAKTASTWLQQKIHQWAVRKSSRGKWKNIGKSPAPDVAKLNTEIDLSRNKSGLWHDYLENHGIETRIASTVSTADSKFIRIHSPDEAANFLGI